MRHKWRQNETKADIWIFNAKFWLLSPRVITWDVFWPAYYCQTEKGMWLLLLLLFLPVFLTFFADVMNYIRTFLVIPSTVVRPKWTYFYTLLSNIVGFTVTPVSVVESRSIHPQPARFVTGVPLQAYPGKFPFFSYVRFKSLMFGFWANYSQRRIQVFTGLLCCLPIQDVLGKIVAGPEFFKPTTWT